MFRMLRLSYLNQHEIPSETCRTICCVYDHPVKLHAGPVQVGDAAREGGGIGQVELDVVEVGATV